MIPRRMQQLPKAGGYPVPFFVTWYRDGQPLPRPGPGAVPDFRVMNPMALLACLRHRKCWICGQPLGTFACFVAGPMSILQRGAIEPPCHRDCAIYAVQTCPHLMNVERQERRSSLPAHRHVNREIMSRYRPSVSATYVTKEWQCQLASSGDPQDGFEFLLGPPVSISWWVAGRPATMAEIRNDLEHGLPELRASGCSPERIVRLLEQLAPYLPPEAPDADAP